jgi:AhpC/TSA family
MSLKEKLDKIKEGFESRAPKETIDLMHRETENLIHSGIMDHIKTVGDKAPDFTLKNTANRDVGLYAALKQNPVVLTFYRGKW